MNKLFIYCFVLVIYKVTAITTNKHCCHCAAVPSCYCKTSATCCQYTLQGSTTWDELAITWRDTLNNLSCCPSFQSSQSTCSNCLSCKTAYKETSTGNGYTSAFEDAAGIDVGLTSRIYTDAELKDYCAYKTPFTHLYNVGFSSTCVIRNAGTTYTGPNNPSITSFCNAILSNFMVDLVTIPLLVWLVLMER